jgi:hypothetical protein
VKNSLLQKHGFFANSIAIKMKCKIKTSYLKSLFIFDLTKIKTSYVCFDLTKIKTSCVCFDF